MSRDTTYRTGGVIVIAAAIVIILLMLPTFKPAICTDYYTVEKCSTNPNGIGNWIRVKTPLQSANTIDDAVTIAQAHLKSLSNPDLAIDEVIEFQNNFYVVYYEKSTGIGSFELIIVKPNVVGLLWATQNGFMRPEQGPNTVWNTKYGIRPSTASVEIAADQAKAYAQTYLDTKLPGTTVGDMHPFYGYYSFSFVNDGKPQGILSVNAFTGEVVYQSWNVGYVQTRELSEDWSY